MAPVDSQLVVAELARLERLALAGYRLEDESRLPVAASSVLSLVADYSWLAVPGSALSHAEVAPAQPKAPARVASQEPPGLDWALRIGLVAPAKLAWERQEHLRYWPALVRLVWQLRLCPLQGGVASLKRQDSSPLQGVAPYSCPAMTLVAGFQRQFLMLARLSVPATLPQAQKNLACFLRMEKMMELALELLHLTQKNPAPQPQSSGGMRSL